MKRLAFVEVFDPADNESVWVRPEQIIQVGRRAKGESVILLANGDVAWYPLSRNKFVNWLAEQEG